MSASNETTVVAASTRRTPIDTSVSRATPSAASLPEIEDAQLTSSRLVRAVYWVLGFVSLGVGIAGYIVPVLPGTVFVLLASYFFFRSSERMYLWVMNHRRFGSTVRAYRAGYGIPRRVKIYAITLMVISVGLSIALAVDHQGVRVFLVLLAGVGAVFILTRPTTENVLAQA